jgi:hypothetical protein
MRAGLSRNIASTFFSTCGRFREGDVNRRGAAGRFSTGAETSAGEDNSSSKRLCKESRGRSGGRRRAMFGIAIATPHFLHRIVLPASFSGAL